MAGAIDEDVRRTVDSGRRTLGAIISTAQSHLQKVFVVFLLVFLGTFYALSLFVWDRLKTDLFSLMNRGTRDATDVVAVTPFDVPLLQVKISLVVGIIAAIPVLLFYSRDALRERGLWPTQRVARWKLLLIGLLSLALGLGGATYAYFVFFPVMFDFLATNAIKAGFAPKYSIVMWAQFVFLLTLSFALAAQLPLLMSGLSLAGIVRYETFRDKWRYAVVLIFVVGAMFSPPDPFTQIMWAVPLIGLYVFSLGLAKLLVALRLGRAEIDLSATVTANWYRLLAGPLVAAGLVYAASLLRLGHYYEAQVAPALRSLGPVPRLHTPGWLLALPDELALLVAAGLVALAVFLVALGYFVVAAVDLTLPSEIEGGRYGDPTAIDVGTLDAAGVRAAPTDLFADMTEEESLDHARAAMADDDPDKAQAILDRFDAAQEAVEADPVEAGATAAAANEVGRDAETSATTGGGMGGEAGVGRRDFFRPSQWPGEWRPASESGARLSPAARERAERERFEDQEEPLPEPAPAATDPAGTEGGSVFSRTTAGVVDAFTEDETTEEDIGGYYYDFAFVLDSLTSKMFRLVGLFMAVLAVTFYWLYQGGIGELKRSFLTRLPESAVSEVDVVTLHPVEALVFEVKISTLLAAIAVLPFVLYYAWPALRDRGLAGGDRRILLVWAGALFGGFVGGSLLGYLYVAPAVISWLVQDALAAQMIVAYRINTAGWLVFFTTAGVGLLATVPITMLLFHRGRIVPYRTMRGRWREVTIAVFALAALLSPKGVFMMFILGIPAMFSYGVGLGLLWLYTLGGRRTPRDRPSAEEPESAD